jgi:hypothetical protein
MDSPRARAAKLHVAIVSRNPETLDGLEAYLQQAGVSTSTTRQIERSAQIGSGVSALVLFPDDFEWDGVVQALILCSSSNPRALPVIVTNAPQRFENLHWPKNTTIPLVVPRPAWGWKILDAIRAHSSGRDESGIQEG